MVCDIWLVHTLHLESILNSESHYGTLLFSSVMSHGRSGSQELGHLKLVAFAGAWLSKEFSRAHWIFPVCAPQKAIYHRYSVFFAVCAPQKAIYPLYTGFFQCVLLKMPFTPLTWHFEEHTLEKSSVLAKTPLKAMLPQKPPI